MTPEEIAEAEIRAEKFLKDKKTTRLGRRAYETGSLEVAAAEWRAGNFIRV